MTSMHAVGAYLVTLRSARGLGVTDVIERMLEFVPDLAPNASYLWRVEHGKLASPGVRLLMAYTAVVDGNADDVARLLLDRHATEADGQRLATMRLDAGTANKAPRLGDGVSVVAQTMGQLRERSEDELVELLLHISAIISEKREARRDED